MWGAKVRIDAETLEVESSGRLFSLSRVAERTVHGGGYSWSWAGGPEVKRFLFTRTAEDAGGLQPIIVLNWFEELRTKAPSK